MGFVRADPDSIPAGNTEFDPEARKKLDAFRAKVKQKMVRQYSTSAELGGAVSRGLHKLQRDFPRPGWVRGDKAMTPDTETKIAEMRAELAELRQAAAENHLVSDALPKIDGLAGGDDVYHLTLEVGGTSRLNKGRDGYSRPTFVWTLPLETTWNEIMEQVGPSLMDEASEREISNSLLTLSAALLKKQPHAWPAVIEKVNKRSLVSTSVDDVLVQLFALGLIAHGMKKRTMSDHNRYWVLTAAGQDQVMRLRAIRRPTSEQLTQIRMEQLQAMTVAELRAEARATGLHGRGVKSELVGSILGAEQPQMD